MGTRIRAAAFAWITAAETLAGCDPSAFDYRVTAENDAAATERTTRPPDEDAAARPEQKALVASVLESPVDPAILDGGMQTSRDVGSAVSPDRPGDAGKPAPANAAGSSAGADAGHKSTSVPPVAEDTPPLLPAADGGMCPQLPSDLDESFCYDFEDGVNGPNAGNVYDLWTTPELPIASQLTVAADGRDSQNHVLRTKPSLTASEASAALSHSTHPFTHATVDFDIWVGEALLGASEEVSWFRYVPMDGDEAHTVALIFRRGQALLRAESGKEQTLTALPHTDGKPTHVTLQLDRQACSADIQLDGVRAASLTDNACAPDRTGFVEFGLVMLDRTSGELSADYDNLAFVRR